MRFLKRDPAVSVSVLFLFCVFGLFILYPMFMTLKLSLAGGAKSYTYLIQKSWLRRSLFNSLELGVITASVATVIGYLFAFLITRTQIKGKSWFSFMATLPVISPPFMFGLAVILLFGKNGFVTEKWLRLSNFDIYGLPGLVFVQSITMFPIAFLTLRGVLLGIESSLEDAALDLGASRLRVFWDVTLKLSIPGILSAWLLVFVTSLADFANPMILAGRFDVLSVQSYLQFTGMGNLPLGAALSNTLLIPCVLIYFIQNYYLKKKSFVTVTGKPQRRDRDLTSRPFRFILGSFAAALSILVLGLYAAVLGGCFTKAWGIDYSFSLDNFSYVMQIGWKTILDTVLISAIATPIAGFVGIGIAYLVTRKEFFGRRFLDLLAILPFALPGTAIGIGYILAFNDRPLLLTGTATIIILSFVFRNMPVGIEAAKASLLQIDKAIEEAATNLGASSFRVFREITLPLLKPALFAGMAYVFVHCMTAVSAVIFLVSAQWNHMTVLILAQTELLRLGAAAVLCAILISIVMFTFWLLQKFIGTEPGRSSF